MYCLQMNPESTRKQYRHPNLSSGRGRTHKYGRVLGQDHCSDVYLPYGSNSYVVEVRRGTFTAFSVFHR